ncbi:MAG: hypothetical protein KTR18_02495 [Acidiferrobacterales bacterium]|nr:hypothetical protein [Acidiferrobacterales bacterium]
MPENPKIAAATGLYLEGIKDGRPQEALDKYIGHRYTQHSTGVSDGKEGFLSFFIPFLERNPRRDIQVLRAIVDGRYVFCHAYQSLNDGESQWVTMDLFDTDENDKIIEHWDVIAAYQDQNISGQNMVDGESEVSDLSATESNKQLIKEFTKQVLIERRYQILSDFVVEDLIEHHPQVANSKLGLQKALEQGVVGRHEMLFKLIGQGNFVATYSSVYLNESSHAVFDLYRVAKNKIVEHWSLYEKILAREQWGNSGKF